MTNLIASFSGMRAQMQNMTKMMKMSGAQGTTLHALLALLMVTMLAASCVCIRLCIFLNGDKHNNTDDDYHHSCDACNFLMCMMP